MAQDDLLQPTLRDVDWSSGPRPWRLQSLYYLAFFGGGLAAAVIAYLNADRLRMGADAKRKIILAGVGYALLVTIARAAMLEPAIAAAGDSELSLATVRDMMPATSGEARVVARAFGLGLAWLLIRMQTQTDRTYGLQHDDDARDSMWIPGLLAALATAPVDIALLIAAVSIR